MPVDLGRDAGGEDEIVAGELGFELDAALQPPEDGVEPEKAGDGVDEGAGEVIPALAVGELVEAG